MILVHAAPPWVTVLNIHVQHTEHYMNMQGIYSSRIAAAAHLRLSSTMAARGNEAATVLAACRTRAEAPLNIR
jgi:hypothetical protein